MFVIAAQPRSPQLVGNSLIESQKDAGVVPTVRYCTSMIRSAGRLPIPDGLPNPAARYARCSSSLMMPSHGRAMSTAPADAPSRWCRRRRLERYDRRYHLSNPFHLGVLLGLSMPAETLDLNLLLA